MSDMSAEYRKILEDQFSSKKEKNHRYSLRAFAKLLNVDVSYLSKLRSGKLILSVDLAAYFADRLRLPVDLRKEFILSAAEEQKCHALYLIDPSLTDCDPNNDSINKKPAPRKRNSLTKK